MSNSMYSERDIDYNNYADFDTYHRNTDKSFNYAEDAISRRNESCEY